MIALERRSILRSRAVGWSMLAFLPVLVFLFFALPVGLAMIAVFVVLFLVVVSSTVALMRRKLAFQRHARQALLAAPSR